MLDEKMLNQFSDKANQAHQQFCIWMCAHNEFVKHYEKWNEISFTGKFFTLDEFSRGKGCKYKKFWPVVISTLLNGWVLSVARLFDPPYFLRDTKKESPRLSLNYILLLLEDSNLEKSIKEKISKYKNCIDSIKKQRDNALAHNDVKSDGSILIKAGIENLFEELEIIISDIKTCKPHLKNCDNLDLKYTKVLSRCGVDEIFEALLKD